MTLKEWKMQLEKDMQAHKAEVRGLNARENELEETLEIVRRQKSNLAGAAALLEGQIATLDKILAEDEMKKKKEDKKAIDAATETMRKKIEAEVARLEEENPREPADPAEPENLLEPMAAEEPAEAEAKIGA